MQDTELDLVSQAQAGDHAAFEELVLLYQKRVYNLALRMSRNPEDALDLSQDIFIRIYKSLPFFKGQSSFSTWLYSIATNACIDFTRREKRKGRVSMVSLEDEENHAAFEIPDVRYHPENEFEKASMKESLVAAIDQLSAEHREVLVLREINGLSYSEIADALDMEAGTVKSRICRAREKLCRLLSKSGNKAVSTSSNKRKER